MDQLNLIRQTQQRRMRQPEVNIPLTDTNDKPPPPNPTKYNWEQQFQSGEERKFLDTPPQDRLDCGGKHCNGAFLASEHTPRRFCSAYLAGRFEPKMPAVGFTSKEDKEDWNEMKRIAIEQRRRAIVEGARRAPPPSTRSVPPTPTPVGRNAAAAAAGTGVAEAFGSGAGLAFNLPVRNSRPAGNNGMNNNGLIAVSNVKELNAVMRERQPSRMTSHPGLRFISRDPTLPW